MARFSDFFKNGVPTGNFTPLVPPIKVEGNKITITDFVYGVTVSSANVDMERRAFFITFKDSNGAEISKYLGFPEPDWSDKRKEMAFRQLFSLGFLFNVMKEFEEAIGDEDVPYSTFAKVLGDLIVGKGGEDIVLKVAFKDAAGVEPKYIIPNNNWISSKRQMEQDEKNPTAKYKNGVAWTTGEYADKRTFTIIEKSPDNFEQNAPGLNSAAVFDPADLDSLMNM